MGANVGAERREVTAKFRESYLAILVGDPQIAYAHLIGVMHGSMGPHAGVQAWIDRHGYRGAETDSFTARYRQ